MQIIAMVHLDPNLNRLIVMNNMTEQELLMLKFVFLSFSLFFNSFSIVILSNLRVQILPYSPDLKTYVAAALIYVSKRVLNFRLRYVG